MAFTLSGNDIDLWVLRSEELIPQLVPLCASLSAEEMQRAEQNQREADRLRFVLGRGVLRTLLSLYTGQEAARLGIKQGLHGKPALAGGAAPRFNLAHSERLLLIAFSGRAQVGVDVEKLRPLRDEAGLVRRVMSPAEQATLIRMAPGVRTRAFFRYWVLKEAVAKASGMGLRLTLPEIEIEAATEGVAQVHRLSGVAIREGGWQLHSFVPEAGYIAALAVEGGLGTIRMRGWTEVQGV